MNIPVAQALVGGHWLPVVAVTEHLGTDLEHTDFVVRSGPRTAGVAEKVFHRLVAAGRARWSGEIAEQIATTRALFPEKERVEYLADDTRFTIPLAGPLAAPPSC